MCPGAPVLNKESLNGSSSGHLILLMPYVITPSSIMRMRVSLAAAM